MASCFACGDSADPIGEIEIGGYAVLRCRGCLSLRCDPLPTPQELARFYATYSAGYTAGMSEARYRREMPKRLAARLELLKRFARRRALLDVGGANGMFARVANDAGWSVGVVDLVPEPVDLGFATVQPGNVSRPSGLPLDDESVDVVSFWSSIEHVRDPEASLREIWRVLRPGGTLAIDTPLVGDFCEITFAARSHWICPPEHLHLYSAIGLQAAVQRLGATVQFHSPQFERTTLRWLARRGRNLALAAWGAAVRAVDPSLWSRLRATAETAAGDIQVMVARKE